MSRAAPQSLRGAEDGTPSGKVDICCINVDFIISFPTFARNLDSTEDKFLQQSQYLIRLERAVEAKVDVIEKQAEVKTMVIDKTNFKIEIDIDRLS